jgi:hypothetical protein
MFPVAEILSKDVPVVITSPTLPEKLRVANLSKP